MTTARDGLNGQQWGPENIAFPIEGVELSILDGDHPFHLAEQAQAADNWIVEKAKTPQLFDGRLVLLERLALIEGRIRGEGRIVPFSTYLWWRKQPDGRGAYHLFGMAVPVSSDGAIIAIRMSPHTANPGIVYCAAGSLDENDVIDGVCDVEANMAREVMEETGLDLSTASADPTLWASRRGRRVNVFRFYRFPLTAAEICARIAEHMVHDHEQEIDAVIEIRDGDPTRHPYNPAMLPVLAHYFRPGRD